MKALQKSLALLLTLVLVLSLGVGAFAAPDDTTTDEVGDDAPIVIAPAPDGGDIAANPKDLDGKTVILHTNDVHGAVANYAAVAALKAEYTARGAEVILVDAGDYSQGTTYVSTTKGADAIAMMNAAGYDVVTLGNHEFDYGYAQLATNMTKAAFKVVCADILGEDGKPIFDPNYTYTTASGLKIGFFGMDTPEAQTKTNPALIKGLTFLTGDALYECAQAQVTALADADLVICLAHLGVDEESAPYRSTDLFAKTTGIDMIIDGHSHTVMTKGDKDEPIQSTGTAIANVGVIVIDNAAKAIERNELVEITADSAKDETVAAAAQTIIDRVQAEYGQVFATSEVTLNGAKAPNGNRDSETNNGDLITDAMVWQVMQNKDGLTVADDMVVALTNGGGIRAAIKPGDVTKNDINTVLPFGNTVALVYVTGAELLEALEASTYCTPTAVGGFPQVSGLEFTVDTTKAYDANPDTYPGSTYYGPASINRVTITSVNGKAFDPAATYAVITNNFCAAGGDTYYAFAAAKEQFDTGVPLDEAVMAYVTEELGGVIGEKYAEPQGRITVKVNPFTDVANDAYYTDAVMWAVDNKITDGTTDTTFSPDQDCNRAQVVTFLWRAAGSPAPTAAENPFTDVAEGDYYYNAVMWAVENGITDGTTDTTFGAADVCTRAQVVTFLFRAGKLDTPVARENPFTDVAEGDYFLEAVLWAVEKGITDGATETTFAPAAVCTRAQVVTFLARAAK